MAREGLDELWIARLNEFRASGESTRAWCERNGVTLDQFYYWRRKLDTATQPTAVGGKPQWLPVRLEETASASAGSILVRVGPAAIEVRQGFDPSLLAEVVRALKTLC